MGVEEYRRVYIHGILWWHGTGGTTRKRVILSERISRNDVSGVPALMVQMLADLTLLVTFYLKLSYRFADFLL